MLCAVTEGKIREVVPRPYDAKYSHTLLVEIEEVYYDEIGHIQPSDVVEIKICYLPDQFNRQRTYRFAGTRECGSNELEISETGVFAYLPDFGAGPCPPYILGGNCDDI